MTITGKIVNILALQTGTSKAGNEWRKQDVVIQTDESFPKTVCLSMWGNAIDSALSVGESISAEITIESREFNGKWYTDVRARRIERTGDAAPVQNPAASATPPPPPVPPLPPADEIDDLDRIFNDNNDNGDVPF
jgi:hypothetical protein